MNKRKHGKRKDAVKRPDKARMAVVTRMYEKTEAGGHTGTLYV